MVKRLEVYVCEICGNIVEVLHGGKGQLVCCGQPMDLCEENAVDAAKGEHVPVVERPRVDPALPPPRRWARPLIFAGGPAHFPARS